MEERLIKNIVRDGVHFIIQQYADERYHVIVGDKLKGGNIFETLEEAERFVENYPIEEKKQNV
jgi:hypothetical protein